MISFHRQYFFQSNNTEDKIYEDCNIICFQVDNILKQRPQEILEIEKLQTCLVCESVLINNNCVICNTHTKWSVPHTSLIEYKIKTSISNTQQNDPFIVFCIDTSGSMGGTRLESVRKACLATLDKLKVEKPRTKVALITFDSTGYYWGDQNRKIRTLNPALLTRRTESVRNISESYDDLKMALTSMQASGGTTICAALSESISIATEVILCTDGEAGDENIQFYDEMIKFSKLNNVRINIITFDDASCKLAILGKFSNETNGIISRTSNALDLTSILSKIANLVVNNSINTSFKLIFNKQEVSINDSNNLIQENVPDKLQKWIYGIKILNNFLTKSDIILQLQIYDSNIVRVLTVKKDVTRIVGTFIQCSNFNQDLLHAKISSSLSNAITKEAKLFSEVNEIIKKYQDLYYKLNRTTIPVSIDNLFTVIRKQNPNHNFKNLNDQDSFVVYNSQTLSKDSINIEKTSIFKNEDQIQVLQRNYQHLSASLKNESRQELSTIRTSNTIQNFKQQMTETLNTISSSQGLKTLLLLLRELLNICRTFLPSIKANLHESDSCHVSQSSRQTNKFALNKQDKKAALIQLTENINIFIQNIQETGLLSQDSLIQKKYLVITNLIDKEMIIDKKQQGIELNNITTLLNTKIIALLKLKQLKSQASFMSSLHHSQQKNLTHLQQPNSKTEHEIIVQQKFYNKIAIDENYSKNLEQDSISVKKDTFGNLAGTTFDLAADRAFDGFSVAVLKLHDFKFDKVTKSLEEKGFITHIWPRLPPIKEFEDILKKSCQLWIISETTVLLSADYVKLIKDFFENKNGVYIWGDNHPFYADANNVAKHLFGCSMHGNVPGDQIVSHQKESNKCGLVSTHLVNTGLTNLYEGNTIATIDNTNDELEPIMFGSAHNLVVAAYNKDGKRAILDGGFTRLFPEFWGQTAGTYRYVKNAAAWLANIENK